MDAASALADLTEISTQVEAAVLARRVGCGARCCDLTTPCVASGLPGRPSTFSLPRTSAPSSGRTLTQLEAALREGSVFVARDDGRSIVAVTGASPTSGLVFYDLRACLRTLAEAEKKPHKKPRVRRPKDEPHA